MALGAPTGTENPSAAFLAGAQHGAALALKNHTATVKPAAVAKTGKTTAKATPQTLDDLLSAARGMASSDVAAQVAAVKAQQQQAQDEAAQRAQQIQLASQAAAGFLGGIGDRTAASYSDAAKQLAGLASGFSGDLRTTATNAANDVAHNLAVIGAPTGPGQGVAGATQAQVAAQPVSLANVLFNQGGLSPANLLQTSGQAFAAAQRALPASTLAYGDQQAQGTIGQGVAQAKALAQQIIDAQATEPKLAQQYLASLQQQLRDQQQQAVSNALAQSLIGSRADAAKVAQGNLTIAQQRLQQQQANADRNYSLALAKLSKGDQPKASASLSKAIGYLVDAAGNPILKDGNRVTLPKAATAKKGPLGLSAKDYQKYTSLALGGARYYHQPWIGKDPKDPSKTVTNKALTWQQFLTHGEAEGIPISILIAQGRKVYSAEERKLDLRPVSRDG